MEIYTVPLVSIHRAFRTPNMYCLKTICAGYIMSVTENPPVDISDRTGFFYMRFALYCAFCIAVSRSLRGLHNDHRIPIVECLIWSKRDPALFALATSPHYDRDTQPRQILTELRTQFVRNIWPSLPDAPLKSDRKKARDYGNCAESELAVG